MDLERLGTTYGPFVFPVFFVAMWLGVTTLLGALSGWYSLMRAYPDCDEAGLLRIGWQSGNMGSSIFPVGMSNILRLEVCPSGLRVGIMRLFGPFCRDIFVPWSDLEIRRRTLLFWPRADFQFGGRSFPTLTVSGDLADRLAGDAPAPWPEAQRPMPQDNGQIVRQYLLQWAAITAFAAAFFTLAPRLMGDGAVGPPVAVAVLFPAIVFGIYTLIRIAVRLGR